MNKYTLYSIVVFPILVMILTTLSTITFSNNSLNTVEKIYSSYFTNGHMEYNKKIVFNAVKNIKETIYYENKNIEYQSKRDLKDKLEIAQKIIQYIYDSNKDTLTTKQMQELAVKRLDNLRFNKNEGYYFIYDSKTNHIIGHAIKKLIGVDFSDYKNSKGNSPVQIFKESLKKNYFTFDKIYFYKPNGTSRQYPKLISTFEFKPLGIIVGTGEYLDEVTNILKNKYLKKIQSTQHIHAINIYIKKDDNTFFNIVKNEISEKNLTTILNDVTTRNENFYLRLRVKTPGPSAQTL